MSLLRAMQQLSFAGARFATGTAVVQARPAQRRCVATAARATSEKGLGKGDLIKAVATKAGLSQKDADGAVNALLDIIESTVASGEAIEMAGGPREGPGRRNESRGEPRGRSAFPPPYHPVVGVPRIVLAGAIGAEPAPACPAAPGDLNSRPLARAARPVCKLAFARQLGIIPCCCNSRNRLRMDQHCDVNEPPLCCNTHPCPPCAAGKKVTIPGFGTVSLEAAGSAATSGSVCQGCSTCDICLGRRCAAAAAAA